MFEKDNSIPPFSSFELHRQASIARNLVIQACVRAAVRASAKWLRMIFLESTRLARGLAAERRRRSAIRDLQRLDDRMLKDIGVQRGEAQDVAAETLAQAFFTVMEARKACNQGQVEAAIKLYESIPLRPVSSKTFRD